MADKKDEEKKIEAKVHDTFLTEDEKAEIKAEALKEVDDENKEQVKADYKAKIKAEATRKSLFKNAKKGEKGEGLVPVYIDIPKVSDCIRLDGACFYPGITYNVSPEVAEVLNEVMGKGQNHEDEVSGRKDSNFGRRKSNPLAR